MAVRRSNRKSRWAADIVLLECSGTELAERNEMKLYYGCISPTERRKIACEDWECSQQKKELLIFEWLFLLMANDLWNGKRYE